MCIGCSIFKQPAGQNENFCLINMGPKINGAALLISGYPTDWVSVKQCAIFPDFSSHCCFLIERSKFNMVSLSFPLSL